MMYNPYIETSEKKPFSFFKLFGGTIILSALATTTQPLLETYSDTQKRGAGATEKDYRNGDFLKIHSADRLSLSVTDRSNNKRIVIDYKVKDKELELLGIFPLSSEPLEKKQKAHLHRTYSDAAKMDKISEEACNLVAKTALPKDDYRNIFSSELRVASAYHANNCQTLTPSR